jgi:F5/8 type C domain
VQPPPVVPPPVEPPPVQPPPVVPPPTGSPVEKAQGQPAVASSFEPAPWFEPQLGNDGRDDSRWSSMFTDSEWWQVDLGRSRWVDKVVIAWNEWAFASRWRIETSADGTAWTTAGEGSQGDPPSTTTTSFAARQARFVRVRGLERGTANGISFSELKVWGAAD